MTTNNNLEGLIKTPSLETETVSNPFGEISKDGEFLRGLRARIGRMTEPRTDSTLNISKQQAVESLRGNGESFLQKNESDLFTATFECIKALRDEWSSFSPDDQIYFEEVILELIKLGEIYPLNNLLVHEYKFDYRSVDSHHSGLRKTIDPDGKFTNKVLRVPEEIKRLVSNMCYCYTNIVNIGIVLYAKTSLDDFMNISHQGVSFFHQTGADQVRLARQFCEVFNIQAISIPQNHMSPPMLGSKDEVQGWSDQDKLELQQVSFKGWKNACIRNLEWVLATVTQSLERGQKKFVLLPYREKEVYGGKGENKKELQNAIYFTKILPAHIPQIQESIEQLKLPESEITEFWSLLALFDVERSNYDVDAEIPPRNFFRKPPQDLKL